ncbi:uncharacterized protein BX663DRAFT_505130 [Cokeromyces recurvatus]|uniref:uncharacterized protein n=1 Tax=Cokeromyces recurvatus TaxID=90255 RepID=UPI00221F8E41|nr:uncharacterized protein BX663DRAFT_505130 [Cokeromyces recurvatus]KAI7904470.1 hypothetical protein BX663DRAFT_505130 [Cokeromyces recurvatus]
MVENKALFESRQKRIRHIKSIAGRNIVWKTKNNDSPSTDAVSSNKVLWPPLNNLKRSGSTSSVATTVEDSSVLKRAYQTNTEDSIVYSSGGLVDTYFTLHNELLASSFYKSEMIPNTVNPTFRSLPTPFDWMNWYDAASSLLVIRVWARHAVFESAGQHTEPVLGYQDKEDEQFQLLIQWQVDLNALVWISKSYVELNYSFPENTLVFEMDDGIYTSAEIKNSMLNQNKRSSLFDLSQLQKDDASIDTINSIQKNKRSYTYNNIMKMNTFMDCIFDTKTSVNEIRQNIQEILEEEDKGFRLRRELNQYKANLMEREYEIIQKKKQLKAKIEKIKQTKREIERRKMEITSSLNRCISGKEDLQDNEIVLEKNIKMRQNIFRTLNRRKKELIADLFSIYPIEQSYDDLQQFYIRGIYLPNSVYDGQNEDLIATALGFTAHLVSMLAYYLEIPLRYPTIPMGSRSTIKDMVSLINGSRDFPLYSRGVDRYRFEFGVFLLNKNIEQLMNAYGLIVMDLRHTLPNIHYFIQAILTTSVTSSPTSISVLSISSYCNGGGRNSHEEHSIVRRDHNHLTLQPTPLLNQSPPPPPSPSFSTSSSIMNISNRMTHSPKPSISNTYPSVAFLNTPQAMAAPAILDTVTTTSSHHTKSP